MRNFFHSYWKIILALILLIFLAALYLRPGPASAAQALAERLEHHVGAIASTEHNTRTPRSLESAAVYIEKSLAEAGYRSTRQEYAAGGGRVRNIEASIGNVAQGRRPERIFIVGAHYDAAQGAPGANDNGSGTAAVLELARLLHTMRPSAGTEVRFVFFVNEEAPWFMGEEMGGMVHPAETTGYHTDTAVSRQLPAGLEGLEGRIRTRAISSPLSARWNRPNACARRWRRLRRHPTSRPRGWRRPRTPSASRCPTTPGTHATAIRR